jgi:hypothetical protein
MGAGYTSGNGGSAVASATATGADNISAHANASGGAAGVGKSTIPVSGSSGPPAANGINGTASATASATVTNLGGTGYAFTYASGSTGNATAQATAMGAGNINFLRSTSISSIPASTAAGITSSNSASGLGTNSSPGSNYAYGILFPTGPQLASSQTGNPNNQATFGPTNPTHAVAIGLLDDYGQASASAFSSTLSLAFTQPVTNLEVGLLNPAEDFYSVPFDNLEFSVTIDGNTAIDMNFSTVTDANAYFTDRVLSFAGPAQNVTVAMGMTSASSPYAGYGLQVEVGAVPEPAVVSFLLVGLAPLVSRRRSRCARACKK